MEANKKFPFYSSFSYRKTLQVVHTYITIQFICNKQGLLLKCDEELSTLYVSQKYGIFMYLYNFSFPANLSTVYHFYILCWKDPTGWLWFSGAVVGVGVRAIKVNTTSTKVSLLLPILHLSHQPPTRHHQ